MGAVHSQLFLLTLAILMAGCSSHRSPVSRPVSVQSASASVSAPAKAVTTGKFPTPKQRADTQQLWMTAAEKVVRNTHDPEAVRVLHFLKMHGKTAIPDTEGSSYYAVMSNDPLAYQVIVLYPEDNALGEPWSTYLSGTIGSANYNPRLRRLILQNRALLTDDAKGILVLHEGRHAMQYVTHPEMDQGDSKTFCYDERDTHEMQNRLMTKLGGSEYRAYLRRKVRWLKTASRPEILRHITLHGREDDGLGKVFHPKSEFEYDIWNSSAWIHSEFIMVDEDTSVPGIHKEDAKAQFLHNLYRASGTHE